MADETKQIMVLMGPYRDHRLTVSAADADAAINGHWAVDPGVLPDPDDPHPPLSDEERTAALEAATTWAKAQWDAAQGVEPPPDPPITRAKKTEEKQEKRDMAPEESTGRYTTRDKR